MIPAANRYTAVLDASVLFPNMKRDLLLRFFEADLYRARWTEQIQQEWLTNAIARYADKEEQLKRTDALMREHFEDAWVEGYERFIETVVLPDRDDRHVVAAAIRINAQYIVTDNLKHFPEDTLGELDIERGSADKFLASTFEHYELEALSIIREHRANLRSNPKAPEYLMNLISKGLPLLSARLKPHRDAI
ncbi:MULTISPECIES: PIN domain-containing protein [Roseobacteraceae]|uniref:Putative ribonuclease VapC50 n=1 Tax=Pseudosulfitobacter pseudonitzschiae TaxID=1402135 RepID=A0A221K8A3_9RHOB|nr:MULTISPECIES: PIN domain-containing protein [Roseobacteraceae]ASM75242.1 putative ribonuclease VapC50 [Pseudosulfitobacter pseudonitzschiae]